MAGTQFEVVDARRCFPCWDEPALKATFKIRVDASQELMVLSNMPITDEKLNGNNVKTIIFESPFMSTYIVGVVVGLFDYIEDTSADGVKVGKGSSLYTMQSRHFDLYIKKTLLYFSVPHSLPKLDLVGVPEFFAGAMENYGLIVYRENELLYDELHSTTARKQISLYTSQ
ncbi:Peptidase M1, alanine aminopeptidase/leukotriene A4 hydrolase [Trema orientale]|uniref:Peptidase M1, alanine aminopeptidase/leukotriene A4 hydrolase n=1 Tax=Trema orientale TaxID=63057 RepID=A0A2P5FW49_TREOI|nr:Peptidase M1, alanine aminopeptidase/leukotriene A4 hydrolase [Trema orientale]